MKKFGIVILVIIIGIVAIKISPVWVHRLFGYSGQTDKVFSPYWINNEEYCYLRVKSYYPVISGWPTPFQMLDNFLRGPNATFYIYKVNINQPDSKKLIRSITEKVNFWVPAESPKLWFGGEELTFRRLDNGELILLIREGLKYIAYYIDTNGKVLNKRVFDYNFIEGKALFDVSPDGTRFLTYNNNLYMKDIASGDKTLFSDKNDRYSGTTRWIYKNRLIIYREYSSDKIEWWKNVICEVYLTDDKKEDISLVFSGKFKKYDEIRPLILDAALSPGQNLIFLSKIGIFKKEDRAWQEVKNLKDMAFNFYYPNWSPDGKRIVGVIDNYNLKVIDVNDLLRN